MSTEHTATAHISFAIAVLLLTLSLVTGASADTYYPAGQTGSDISFPQCGALPSSAGAFGIVGVTAGRAFSQNDCLAEEFAWATEGASTPTLPSLYMNLQYAIGRTASYALSGPAGDCNRKDKACQAYNYGWNAAGDAYAYASGQGAASSRWWLDIETANSWSAQTTLNALVIQGALDYLGSNDITAGIYSTPRMWTTIAGSFHPDVESWVAQATEETAASYCTATGPFGTGPVALVQYVSDGQDWDYACP